MSLFLRLKLATNQFWNLLRFCEATTWLTLRFEAYVSHSSDFFFSTPVRNNRVTSQCQSSGDFVGLLALICSWLKPEEPHLTGVRISQVMSFKIQLSYVISILVWPSAVTDWRQIIPRMCGPHLIIKSIESKPTYWKHKLHAVALTYMLILHWLTALGNIDKASLRMTEAYTK